MTPGDQAFHVVELRAEVERLKADYQRAIDTLMTRTEERDLARAQLAAVKARRAETVRVLVSALRAT